MWLAYKCVRQSWKSLAPSAAVCNNYGLKMQLEPDVLSKLLEFSYIKGASVSYVLMRKSVILFVGIEDLATNLAANILSDGMIKLREIISPSITLKFDSEWQQTIFTKHKPDGSVVVVTQLSNVRLSTVV